MATGETHQAGQALLAAEVVRAVHEHAWPSLDPQRIKATLPQLVTLVAAIVRRYGLASSVYAQHFYRQERAAAGVRGPLTFPKPQLPPTEQVVKSMQWATGGLYGPVTSETEQKALTNVEGATEKMVLDVGRQILLDAAKADREARGWARVPEAGACSFCLLMATRGAVYKNEGTAGKNANDRFIGEGQDKWHDHCRCHIEPVFSDHYEPTAQVRAAQALYKATPYGRNAAEARNNFRVALERQRTAPRRAVTTSPGG